MAGIAVHVRRYNRERRLSHRGRRAPTRRARPRRQVTLGSSAGNVSIPASVSGSNLTQSFVVTAGTSNQTLACSTGAPTDAGGGRRTARCERHGHLPWRGGRRARTTPSSPSTAIRTKPYSARCTSRRTARRRSRRLTSRRSATSSRRPQRGFSLGGGANERAGNSSTYGCAESRDASSRPSIPGARAAMRQRRVGSTRFPAIRRSDQIVPLNANGVGSVQQPDQHQRARRRGLEHGDRRRRHGQSDGRLHRRRVRVVRDDVRHADQSARRRELRPADGHRQQRQDRDLLHEGSEQAHAARQRTAWSADSSSSAICSRPPRRTGWTGAPTSNFAEMFYVARAGSERGVQRHARQASDVLSLTPGTLAHEYQHLINAGRRLYVNTTPTTSRTSGSTKGLSHIAEELLYYKVAGLAPRQNIDVSDDRRRRRRSTQFNKLPGRQHRPLRESSSASRRRRRCTRTTIRSRRAARRGTCCAISPIIAARRDGDTWIARSSTRTTTGQHNLSNVFGTSYLTQIRDWATSVFADDVPGVTDARFLEPSWNMRNIFPSLVNSSGPAARQVIR